jgi:DNA topoisomerase-3
MLFAERIAQEKGIVIPDETKASAAAMSAWIESNQGTERGKRSRKTANKPSRSTAPNKRTRRRTSDNAATPPIPARQNSGTDTPLRIPYGNKDDALKLGARYRSGGWYAPPGVDLAAFGERGWL